MFSFRTGSRSCNCDCGKERKSKEEEDLVRRDGKGKYWDSYKKSSNEMVNDAINMMKAKVCNCYILKGDHTHWDCLGISGRRP